MVIDPVLTAILVIIGFAAVGAVSPIMNAARSQKKNPELEEKLRLVDELPFLESTVRKGPVDGACMAKHPSVAITV